MQQVGSMLGVSESSVCRYLQRAGIQARKPLMSEPDAYQAGHRLVRKLRGKPQFCEECKTTTAKRYEWASVTHDYSNPQDYRRLCTKCHHRADGLSLSKAQQEVISLRYLAGVTMLQIARDMGIAVSTVCENLQYLGIPSRH